jgi:toxin ParE1/3/4
MSKLVRTSRAELDMAEIWADLAQYGTKVADRTIDVIEKRMDVLRRFPYGGEACPRFGAKMRWFPAGNYVIFYLPEDDRVCIVRVIDGRRDLRIAFSS